jgi:hypothetical protein
MNEQAEERSSAGIAAEFFTLKRGTEDSYSETACFLKDGEGNQPH